MPGLTFFQSSNFLFLYVLIYVSIHVFIVFVKRWWGVVRKFDVVFNWRASPSFCFVVILAIVLNEEQDCAILLAMTEAITRLKLE